MRGGLVLGNIDSLQARETTRIYSLPPKSGKEVILRTLPLPIHSHSVVEAYTSHLALIPGSSREISLPLNGFSKNEEEESSYSPDQPERPEGRSQAEDWPDWSDPEEGEQEQPVQTHIQASDRTRDQEEEPWDNVEDTEPTFDLSPTAPIPDPVVLTAPPPPLNLTAEPLRGGSKPLKLSYNLKALERKTTVTSSWDNGWGQEEEPQPNDEPRPKLHTARKDGGTRVLGEEFTIEVKRKQERDPELDFFADMEPDIKLSSAVALLLPVKSNVSDTGLLTAAPSEHTEPSVDTLTLPAKFAAADQTEVSPCERNKVLLFSVTR